VKKYYRLMLGKKSVFAKQCFAGNFVGVDYQIPDDLTHKLPGEWRVFNKQYIPVYLAGHPDKTRIAAGLACGTLWTVAKGMQQGDIVLCPDGTGAYRLGEISGDYQYAPGEALPHRRPVHWLNLSIDRAAMSEALQNSTGAIGAISDVSGHHEEIDRWIGGSTGPIIVSSSPEIEDAAAFVMESHLEDFLVENWAQTELGKHYDIFEDEGEKVGKQYQTDTGAIDVLAIRKDKKELLVVELKKGRASDAVVGQVLRYMGYAKEQLADKDQKVKGVIIAHDDDPKLRRALVVTPDVSFYRYQVSFKLVKA